MPLVRPVVPLVSDWIRALLMGFCLSRRPPEGGTTNIPTLPRSVKLP